MSDAAPEWPAKPGTAEPRRLIPEWPMLWRGLGLAGLAIALLWAAISSLRLTWFLAPVSAVFGIGAVLSAWASAIHLTGGERFDDHPWV